MNLLPLHTAIRALMAQKDAVLVAIDGPCASGKSTLAQMLGEYYNAPVISMDDFFLPPHLRTEERLCQPGGNVDSERFWTEVLSPLTRHQQVSYRPWRCGIGAMGDVRTLSPAPLVFVEGVYSLRPDLREHYDLRVYLSASLSLREDRILKRNGADGLKVFQDRWIPLENHYFQSCQVETCCHLVLTSDNSNQSL